MITERIAGFIIDTSYKDIPHDAVAMAKRCLLDCFGVGLFASRQPTGKIIIDFVREQGGQPQSGVIGAGFKTSVSQAALANGTLGHALDYDDYGVTWVGHPTVVLLPAVFALAEGNNICGEKVIEAYIIGWEVGAKIAACAAERLMEVGWHPTAVVGSLAAAAASAKLLGLDRQQTRTAMGIAASQTGGLRINFGTDTKPFHAGKAASNGVTAAILAGKGFTANDAILEDPALGFCSVFAREGYDVNKIVEDLGSPYDINIGACIKPYPACGLTHRCLDAISYLVKEHRIAPEEVEEVKCHTPAQAEDILIYPRPQSGLHGKFSMHYCMATILLEGKAGLREFTDEKVLSSAAQEMIKKVSFIHPEGPPGATDILRLANTVSIKLKDGREVSNEVKYPKGDPQNPMSWEETAEKFRDCTKEILSSAEAEDVIQMLGKLESLTDVADLMELVSQI
jgi:2-methylcitrate dehydratase PrpD